jgi:hypothetical protein
MTSKINWPCQQMPNIKTFSTWRSIIKQITKSSAKGHILQKLGMWITKPSEHHTYNTLIHHNNNTLLVQENRVWWILQKSHNVQATVYFTKRTKQAYVPEDSKSYFNKFCPVDVETSTLFIALITIAYRKSKVKKIHKTVDLGI